MFTGSGNSSESEYRGNDTPNKRKIVANGSSNGASNTSIASSKEKDALQFTPTFSMTKSVAKECGLQKFYQIVS